MYIGPVKERKNVFRIVEAFNIFKEKTKAPHKLFLVGRKSKGEYEAKVSALIETSPYKDVIVFKTMVSDEVLPDVYKNAEALVFPSLLEGFGLPVLEALSLGCMVITSKSTSTKEALGDAGILVDPINSAEIAEAMMVVSNQAYNRDVFLRNASQQCTKFSWKKSGQGWKELLLGTQTINYHD